MKTKIFSNSKAIGIKLSENATEQEKYAASELANYLEMMTSSVFDVGTDIQAPVIAIGKVCCEFGVDFSCADDEFIIKTVGENICIAGGKRGVIYGVYEFLEKLGCRFFTAACERVPFVESIEIDELDEKHTPDFVYREHNYYEPVRYTKFAVKSRLNGKSHQIAKKYGGHIDYSWFVHSFENIISPQEFAESHPEYFAMDENGVRQTQPHKNQLCLSNPELIPIACEKIRENLRQNPDAQIISISQNDWILECHCPECQRINSEEGSASGTLIRFVNAIAERLEDEFPNVMFDTLAYQYTRSAPKITKPRHNVCIRLCSIECCFLHPFEGCSGDDCKSFVKDLNDWHKTGAQLYIWDYTTCFNFYPTPHPNWRSLQKNMKLFKKNGAIGVFEQANGASHGSSDLNELRAYVISKLLWDSNTDVQRHIEEFCDCYYGKAGKYIREYINTLCDAAEKEGEHVGFNDYPTHAFLQEKYLSQYEQIFNRAKEAVKDSPIHLYRVERAFLSIRYVRLFRKFLIEKQCPKEELNQFFVDWQNFGFTRMEEWCSPQTTHKALLRGLPMGSMFYSFWAEEGAEEL